MARSDYPTVAEVREWGMKYYHGVHPSSRLPHWLIAEWDRHHPKRKYVASEAHHGSLYGYTKRKCKCDECRAIWNAYVNRRYHERRGNGIRKDAA